MKSSRAVDKPAKPFSHRGIQAGCAFDSRAARVIKKFGPLASHRAACKEKPGVDGSTGSLIACTRPGSPASTRRIA